MHPNRLLLSLLTLEDRTVPSAVGFRTIDGTGNNVAHPQWGSTDETFLRAAPAAYGDGISTPAGANRSSARAVSNAVSAQDEDVISSSMLSAMVYAWGQFIDHDMTLTAFSDAESLSIPVPEGDPYFDPQGTGTQVIRTTRSAFAPTTGTDRSNPRQQVNEITAWLDGSMVYGSDGATASKLRTLSGGRLKVGANGLLPLNNASNFPTGTLDMVNTSPFVDDDDLFAAGDIRANENVELTALQTLFLREHNRWAGRIAAANPSFTDQQLYHRAREIVVAEIQAITYREWLPTILGPGALDPYRGYNAGVNPQMSNEFSTAGFRFGHSLLGDDVKFLDNRGLETREGVALADAFTNPDLVRETNIDPILKYLASDPASELDTRVVNGVRNFLFGPPGAGGLDLASLNIERGRDHGLSDYNTTRAAYGLPRVTSFAQITPDAELQTDLRELYGSVNNIDLWVGSLAESHVAGGSVGPTLAAIISDQFERLRDGDRFWYTRNLSPDLLRQVQGATLADIIERNTRLTSIQTNAFTFRAEIGGMVGGPQGAGKLVQLIAADGEVVATKRTDSQGNYAFTVADGLRTGVYTVRLVPPADAKAPPPPPPSRPIAITGGDVFVRNVNFAPPPPPRHRAARPPQAGLGDDLGG